MFVSGLTVHWKDHTKNIHRVITPVAYPTMVYYPRYTSVGWLRHSFATVSARTVQTTPHY